MARQKKGYLLILTANILLQDVFLVFCAFLGAFWFRFFSGIFPVHLGIPDISDYVRALPLAAGIFIIFGKVYGLYNETWLQSKTRTFILFCRTAFSMIFMLMGLSFLYRGLSYSRAVMVISLPLLIIAGAFQRYYMAKFGLWLRRVRNEEKQVLFIGTGKIAQRIYGYTQRHPRLGYRVAGFLTQSVRKKPEEGEKEIPIIGVLDDLQSILVNRDVDEVIMTLHNIAHKDIMKMVMVCERSLVDFKMVPDTFEILSSVVDVEQFMGIPLIGIKKTPLEYLHNRILKRVFDIAGSLAGFCVLLPFYPLIAALIKLDSPGPVLYKQKRLGEDGREFTLYKFRTMRLDAEKATGPVWASENDLRCTKIGRFLRSHNIDEFPQLWNVLAGHMSLVGPRPERPHFVDTFKHSIPRYMSRHLIKSGITGWAQVNGLRGNTSITDRIQYDLYYMENWSLVFDIKIVLMTVLAVENAY